MAWYRTGRASSVAGSNVITGVGTLWANNVFGIAPGQMIFVPGAGQVFIYEILSVDSDTKIRVTRNIATAITNSEYAIVTTVSNSMSDLARRTAVQLDLYQQLLEDWQNITTGTGDVTIIAPDGTEVVIPALSWISDSKTWFDTNKELIENAGEAVAGAETARDQAVAANTAAQAAKTTAVDSATTASNAEATATGAATTATTAKNDAVAAKTAAEAAAASVNLPPLGIGLPSMTLINNFDWQNFVFTSGANYLAASTSWINTPAGVGYPTALAISITVDYITVSSNQIGLTLIPNTATSVNFKVYKVLSVGAAGSRVFTVREEWNSANPIPISGGGTGANTLAGAQSALGIVDQLFTILYPNGTEASPASIGASTRLTVANPFAGRRVDCAVELRVAVSSVNQWGEPGWIYLDNISISLGTKATPLTVGADNDKYLVIQSGSRDVMNYSVNDGNPHGVATAYTSLPFRLKVWTID